MFGTFVIPLDGSPFSAQALPIGISLAEAAGAGVHIIGIARNDGELAWVHRRVFDSARQAGIDEADVEVRIDPRPVDVLIDVASDDDNVLCFASHDRVEPAATIMHAVGSAVIERARRPLVVVGPGAQDKPDGDIVVGVDPRTDAEPVLAVAAAWANRLRCGLRFVTVYEPVLADLRRPDHYTRHHGPEGDVEVYLASMRERVADVGLLHVDTVAIADPVSVGAGLEAHLAEHPARLLVVGGGQHDHPTLSPGVARHMLRHAPVPLLLVGRSI